MNRNVSYSSLHKNRKIMMSISKGVRNEESHNRFWNKPIAACLLERSSASEDEKKGEKDE